MRVPRAPPVCQIQCVTEQPQTASLFIMRSESPVPSPRCVNTPEVKVGVNTLTQGAKRRTAENTNSRSAGHVVQRWGREGGRRYLVSVQYTPAPRCSPSTPCCSCRSRCGCCSDWVAAGVGLSESARLTVRLCHLPP